MKFLNLNLRFDVELSKLIECETKPIGKLKCNKA